MAFIPSVNAAEIRKNELGQKSLNDLKEKYAVWAEDVLGQIKIREKGVFYFYFLGQKKKNYISLL